MPKTKLQQKVSGVKYIPTPPANHFEDLMRRYMRAQKLNNRDLAAKLECSEQNISHMLRRPIGLWNVNEVYSYCDVIGIPLDIAFAAIASSKGA